MDFSTIDFPYFEGLIAGNFISLTPLQKIWQVLLSAIAADHLIKNETGVFSSGKFNHFAALVGQIPKAASSPEFPVAIQLLSQLGGSASVSSDLIAPLHLSMEKSLQENSQEIRSPLMTLSAEFECNFKQARVSKKNIIFVDGIDVKPNDMSQARFKEHLSAFARAALHLNGVFAHMKGGGYLKFVILLRPDVFNGLGLQNQSAKVSDNALVLSWNSSSANFKNFDLYSLSNGFLAKQNDVSGFSGDAWDYYVNPDVYGGSYAPGGNRSFLEFVRYSWFRPRDVIRLLRMCQEAAKESEETIDRGLFERSRQNFSDYLLGEVRDYWRFYYDDYVFDLVLDFFHALGSQQDFSYETFTETFSAFLAEMDDQDLKKWPTDLENPKRFLQALYSANIICWRDYNDFGKLEDHWSFRERQATQSDPRIPIKRQYAVHYGLRKSLHVKRSQSAVVG